MSLPDNIRSLFGAIPGAMPRGSAISAMAGPGFITGAEANQSHAQAGTRAGGWAEGMGSNANAVNGLAGTALVCEPCVPNSISTRCLGTVLPVTAMCEVACCSLQRLTQSLALQCTTLVEFHITSTLWAAQHVLLP